MTKPQTIAEFIVEILDLLASDTPPNQIPVSKILDFNSTILSCISALNETALDQLPSPIIIKNLLAPLYSGGENSISFGNPSIAQGALMTHCRILTSLKSPFLNQLAYDLLLEIFADITKSGLMQAIVAKLGKFQAINEFSA